MSLVRRLVESIHRTLVRWDLATQEVYEVFEPATRPIQTGWGFFTFIRALLGH